MANEIVQNITNNLSTCLESVADALPGDFNRSRFLQNTIALIRQNPDLQKYSPTELLTGSMQAAYLGLDFMNKEAWLVPYSGHVQFQLGYKGACKFVKKYSIRPLSDLYAKAVRKGDNFDYGVKEGEPYINWEPVPFNGSEIAGVFAVAVFKDGGKLYEVMSKEEVDKIRNRSKCGKSGPWVTDYEQMALKTVLKRLAKNIETDFDNVDQRNAWEADNDEFDKNRITDAEVIDPFTEEQAIEVEATIIDEEIMKEADEVFQ